MVSMPEGAYVRPLCWRCLRGPGVDLLIDRDHQVNRHERGAKQQKHADQGCLEQERPPVMDNEQ
jgi:hypothetical protein